MQNAGRLAAEWLSGRWAAVLVGAAVLQFGWNVHNVNTPKWLGLYAVAFVMGFALLRRARAEGGLRLSPPSVVALTLLAWFCASLAWSPVPFEGVLRAGNAVSLFVVFIWFATVGGRAPWDFLAIAGVGLSLLRPGDFGGFGNTIFQSEFLLLLAPFCRWYVAAGVLVFLGAFDGATLSGDGGSSAVWLVCGVYWLALVAWVWRRDRGTAAILAALPVSIAALWFWGAVDVGDEMRSLRERAELWTNTAAMWADGGPWRWLAGVGLGGFVYWYPYYSEAHMALFPGMETYLTGLTVFVNAAHNDWLELGAVSGAVGLLAGLGFVALLFHRAGPKERVFLGVCAALMAVNFPMQNPGSAAVAAVASGLIARRWRAD